MSLNRRKALFLMMSSVAFEKAMAIERAAGAADPTTYPPVNITIHPNTKLTITYQKKTGPVSVSYTADEIWAALYPK